MYRESSPYQKCTHLNLRGIVHFLGTVRLLLYPRIVYASCYLSKVYVSISQVRKTCLVYSETKKKFFLSLDNNKKLCDALYYFVEHYSNFCKYFSEENGEKICNYFYISISSLIQIKKWNMIPRIKKLTVLLIRNNMFRNLKLSLFYFWNLQVSNKHFLTKHLQRYYF